MDMFSKDGIVMFLILIPLEDRNERWKWLMAKLDNNDMRALYFEAYKILCNKEDAEDVLHEAILKAFKKCHQIKDESRFFYWMLRIVRNEALTYKKHCMRHLLFMQSKFISNENIYEDSAEYLYFREKQNDRLYEKINALRSPEKEILKMRIYQKKAFPDIAKELNLNYHTVRSQYQRSIKKIKRILEENDYE